MLKLLAAALLISLTGGERSVYVDCMPLLDEIFNQELDRDLLNFWTENSRAFANLASCVEYSRIPVDRP